MILSSLKLTQFRNYNAAHMQFHPGFNALVGLNGMGKTNILDAIYYLCLGKSNFSSGDRMVIMQDQDFFRVEGTFVQEENIEKVVIRCQSGNRKEIEISGKKLDKIGDHIGRFLCVIIAPADIQQLLDSSEDRRHYVNNTIVQTNRAYLEDLIIYSSLLKRRNAVLKSFADRKIFDALLLESITNGMYEPAHRIYEVRKLQIEQMQSFFSGIYKKISGGGEVCNITYQSQLEGQELSKLMLQHIDKDKILARTTQGIHKDDLIFTMNGQPLKHFASQGQLKSFVLALKLTQYKIIEQNAGRKPILLLDDIFDKLDQTRVKHLLEMLLHDHFGQVFITDTNGTRMQQVLEEIKASFGIFTVEKGQIMEGIQQL